MLGVGIGVAIGATLLAAASFLDLDMMETGSVTPAPAAQPQVAVKLPEAPAQEAIAPKQGDTSRLPAVAKPLPSAPMTPPQVAQAHTADDLRAGIAPDAKPLTPPQTANAPSQAPVDVAIAETEADVAHFEITTGMVEPPAETETEMARLQRADNPGEAAAEPAAAVPSQIPSPQMASATISRYVNLRSGPADEAGVILVVPAGAKVQAESGCEWCVVSYNGQRGYIYKSFLRRKLTETPGLY